jgi:hypothetical protein
MNFFMKDSCIFRAIQARKKSFLRARVRSGT